TSCTKAPTACFNADVQSVNVGEEISFTDCSSDAASWLWDFGDGVTSTAQNPNHYYDAGGDYTVTLSVYSANDKKNDSKTMLIKASDYRDKFIGTWNVSQTCGTTNDSYQVTISKSGTAYDVMLVDNFYNLGLNDVEATASEDPDKFWFNLKTYTNTSNDRYRVGGSISMNTTGDSFTMDFDIDNDLYYIDDNSTYINESCTGTGTK
ncbi:MAG: PKD domain-containing protein, partial [Flavobacteriales bacterium]